MASTTWEEFDAQDWEKLTPITWLFLKGLRPTSNNNNDPQEPTMATDHSTLLTTVQNTSGQRLNFGFLPPHGKELADDEQMTIFGHITEAIQRGDRFGNRHSKALMDALDNGWLDIISTPTPVFYDSHLAISRIVVFHNGVLHLLPPSWEASVTL